ncbi:glycosyltransferase family 4 protein [Rhodococcoides fascians]|uniref:Glycogen synthase n=1 Tax=Rhodococcoides fascians TaxID=1828 RepID=A0A143QKQ7_RHOFA|nr:glycosyltransferase family 4 protein [Rhodococcus fascians]AMY23376.1 Glycogen synthase [Rhodococcus fascians]OZC38916.1 glycosyltransferase family 4 protein [Rhodococcus fascians]
MTVGTDSLRIALIASNRFPIKQPFAGGLEAHTWHLAHALAHAGHQVTLYAGPGSDPGLNTACLDVDYLRISDRARADVSMPSDVFMSDHHAYQQLMLDLASDRSFDVIHNHSLHYLPVAMAPTLSTPFLTTLHTPPTPWIESAIAASHGVGTRFAAVSSHTASMWDGIIDEIDIVPNGVDIETWHEGEGGAYLVWSGRFTPEKGPHLAIQAAEIAGYPLKMAGPISDPDYFSREIGPRLGERTTYVGHLEQKDLATLVGGAAAALVTPAWDEPYGLVVAEALACGTPVAAFARGGIPEILSRESGCLVAGDDVNALAAAIPRTVSLSRADVRKRAVQHCSSETMLTAYLRLYREMIASPVVSLHSRRPHRLIDVAGGRG